MSLELSHRLKMEAMMYYENIVLEQPKQLQVGGKVKYCSCSTPRFKNAQYDKSRQKAPKKQRII